MFRMTLQGRPAAIAMAAMLAAAPLAAQGAGAADGTVQGQATVSGQASMRKMAVLEMTDRGEVEMGRLALSRSTNAAVRRYAQMMVDEHTASLANRTQGMQGMEAAVEAHMDDPFLREMSAAHRAAMASLQSQSGAAFDRMYMQNQVDAHTHLLAVLNGEDGTEIRAPRNPSGVISSGSTGTNTVPQSGGYAVPLSCDPLNTPAGPSRGNSEGGINRTPVEPKGSCDGTPPSHPPLNGDRALHHSVAMNQLHGMATQMVSTHLAMARDILGDLPAR